MKLYLAMNFCKHGRQSMGRVYHLRESCPSDTAKNDVLEVPPSLVKIYAKTLGIKRICLKCRKAFAKKGNKIAVK